MNSLIVRIVLFLSPHYFIEKLDRRFKIVDKNVYYIIEDIKKEAFMSDPDLVVSEIW